MLSESTKLMIETKLEEIIDSIMEPYCYKARKYEFKRKFRAILYSYENKICIFKQEDMLELARIKLIFKDDNNKNMRFYNIELKSNSDKQQFKLFESSIFNRILDYFTQYKFYEILFKYKITKQYEIKF